MKRSLIFVGLILGLGACRPAAGDAAVSTTRARDAVPVDADWHFAATGSTAALAFGEDGGDDADRLFRLGCRLNTQRVRADWPGQGDAVLTSGTATGTFRKQGEAAADSPVFTAFRSGGTLSVGLDDADLTLTAKEEGRAQIKAFFAFCTQPLPPPAEPEPAPPPEPVDAVAPPSDDDDAPEDVTVPGPVAPDDESVSADAVARPPVEE
ncbi:hypothetical protein BZG35_04585 [Brevundimonas sp. LM2]|uniref:hypothetical protein n=1 Tax=Brevundimonas sp. LM2 TaxID=1938605 RepID=UPI000983A33C|nr:hypothetical protein [Brevundimonas sp. LM2]AQR61018.1 hypothetical protein BZG35_04585 [Brevundimonas sp. LM2]